MPEAERKEFLLSIYNQMWSNINRHILLTWQPVALIFTVIGLFALAGNNIVNYAIIISIVILFCGWYLAHIIDSSHWFNRNIVIISNIEKQFLMDSDEKEVHFYFKRIHKQKEKMIDHFKIQFSLGIGIIIISILLYLTKISWKIHLSTPSISSIINGLPFIFLLIITCLLWKQYKNNFDKYNELISKSPGKINEKNKS